MKLTDTLADVDYLRTIRRLKQREEEARVEENLRERGFKKKLRSLRAALHEERPDEGLEANYRASMQFVRMSLPQDPNSITSQLRRRRIDIRRYLKNEFGL